MNRLRASNKQRNENLDSFSYKYAECAVFQS